MNLTVKPQEEGKRGEMKGGRNDRGEFTRERAALLADGRREAAHGIPPAASNGPFTSTQLRQASSED